jgi:hypothetical protein
MKLHAASVTRPSVDVGCALEAMRAEIAELRALIEQPVVSPPSERGWVSVDEAAVLIRRSPQAVRKRGRVNKIGLKVNGEWRVDRARLLSQNLRDAKAAGPVT